MTSLLAAPLAGCGAVTGGSYCDVTRPILFESDAVVDSVMGISRDLVQDVVTHNEIYERLCKKIAWKII